MVGDNIILVRLRFTTPKASVKDDLLSEQVCKQVGADGRSMRVNKDLIKINDVLSYRRKGRRILRERGVPWSPTRTDEHGNKKEDAWYALAGVEIDDVSEQLLTLKEKYMEAAADLRDQYQTKVIDDAIERLGSSYNPEDYPSAQEFYEQFSWETEVMMLSEMKDIEKDFRLKLPAKMAEEQVALALRKEKQRVQNCIAEVFARTEQLILGSENNPGPVPSLRDYNPDAKDKRKGNTFRNKSIYAKIDAHREFVEGVNSYAEDAGLAKMVKAIDVFATKIRPSDPEQIRTSPIVRNKVIAGLMGILGGDQVQNTTPQPATGAGQFV